jgi:hypothetical protein
LYVAPHLSQAEAVYAGAKARIAVSMVAVVAGLATVDFTQHKQQLPRALAFLQQVQKRDWKKRQREVFGTVMTGVVANGDPTGRPLRKAEQRDLIDYCWDNRIEFISAYPTIAVNNALCEAGISDPKHKPQKSDGIDLAHAVMALGYCNYFIVRDGSIASCARHAEKRLAGLAIARVVADPGELPVT